MKQSIFFIICLLGALSAKCEYLNWQLTSEIIGTDEYLKGLSLNEGNTLAVVRYGTDTANLGSWKIAENAVAVDFAEAWGIDPTELGDDQFFAKGGLDKEYSNQASVDLSKLEGGGKGLSYYIEVYRYNEAGGYYEGVARSEHKSYGDLENYISAGGTVDPSFNYEIWQGTGYSIPEPTSAMLLMIGLSLVGLKRKRA